MKTAVIYVIGFPNGKLYVGRTVQRVARRFQGHCRSKQPVGRAIRKYGPENCPIMILRRDLSWQESATEEQFWIAELGTTRPELGYNLTAGGEGMLARPVPQAQRRKLSEATKRQWQDPDFRSRAGAAMSKAVSKVQKGRSPSPAQLRHIHNMAAKSAEARRGKKLSPEHRAKVLAALARRRPRGTS